MLTSVQSTTPRMSLLLHRSTQTILISMVSIDVVFDLAILTLSVEYKDDLTKAELKGLQPDHPLSLF